MMEKMTIFTQLNLTWNAHPTLPEPKTKVIENDLLLEFLLDDVSDKNYGESRLGLIRFTSCHKFRFTGVNDEGWHLGQCRFSKFAPNWGNFYEVTGNFKEEENQCPWNYINTKSRLKRNFLFYFKDETFECIAGDWNIKY